MTIATATEVKNNFGFYLNSAIEGNDIVIMKNGKEVARLISNTKAISYLTDSLVGVLANDYDDKAMNKERFSRQWNCL